MNLKLLPTNFILAKCDSEINNLHNRNVQLLPKPATHFESSDDRDNHLMYNDISLEPDNDFYDSDKKSHIGWTYVADYTTHHLTHAGSNIYYIHCRINRENALEFGVFNTKLENNAYTSPLILSKKICNRNQPTLLKIANKEESEKFLLSEDNTKIKLSANPKFAGYLINEDVFIIDEEACPTLGHIWTYWYAIENNTLYFCGFPLYIGEDKGHIYDGQETHNFDIPPTPVDASMNPEFGESYNMIFAEDGNIVKRILEKYGDKSGKSVIASFPLYKLQNAINLDTTAAGLCGGVLNGEVYDADDIDTIEHLESSVVIGDSGYLMVPTRIPVSVTAVLPDSSDLYSPSAVVIYEDCHLAYNFIVALIGNSYDISITPATYILDGKENVPFESPYESPKYGNYGFNVDYITPGGGGSVIGGGGSVIDRKKKTKEKKVKEENVTIEHDPVGTIYIDDIIHLDTTDLKELPKYYTEVFYSNWSYSINEDGISEKGKYYDYEVDLRLKRSMDFRIRFNPEYLNDISYHVKKTLNFGNIFYPRWWQDLIINCPSDGMHNRSGVGMMNFGMVANGDNIGLFNKVTGPPAFWDNSSVDPEENEYKVELTNGNIYGNNWEYIKNKDNYEFIVPLKYNFTFIPSDPLIGFVKKPEVQVNTQNIINTNTCKIVPLDIYGNESIKTSFRVPASKISPELYKRKCRITYRVKQAWVKAKKAVIDKIIQSEIRERLCIIELDDLKCLFKNFKIEAEGGEENLTPIYRVNFKAVQETSHNNLHECSSVPRESDAFRIANNENNPVSSLSFYTEYLTISDTQSLSDAYGDKTPITNLVPAVLVNNNDKATKLGLKSFEGNSDLVLRGLITENITSKSNKNLSIEPLNIGIMEHNSGANNWCEVDFSDLGNREPENIWRYNFELEGNGDGTPTISISGFTQEEHNIELYQIDQPIVNETN